MFKIIPHKKIWFTFSGLLVVASIVIIATLGLPLGIDFTGGSLLEFKVRGVVPEVTEMQAVLEAFEEELGEFKIQASGSDQFIVRSPALSEDQHQAVKEAVRASLEPGTELNELRFESIGPTLGVELKDKAVVALIVTAIGIILFVAWSFRHVSQLVQSWKYGLSAIIALVHDVLITTGVFAVAAKFAGFQVDALFVTALLVTLGYSVNDTIVVFDRTRENLKIQAEKRKKQPFAELVNQSVNSTITRSINTSLTTLLVLVALLVLGGSSIAGFITTLIIGVLIGTYSSIFLASPLLVLWTGKR